jgi:hypothetical protein
MIQRRLAAAFRRVRALDRTQRVVLAQALVLTPIVDRSLRRRGTMSTISALDRRAGATARSTTAAEAIRLVTPVEMVGGHRSMGAACLTRSIVGWFVLRRRGIHSDIVIGARLPADSGELDAHAWLEYASTVINDAPDIRARYGTLGSITHLSTTGSG